MPKPQQPLCDACEKDLPLENDGRHEWTISPHRVSQFLSMSASTDPPNRWKTESDGSIRLMLCAQCHEASSKVRNDSLWPDHHLFFGKNPKLNAQNILRFALFGPYGTLSRTHAIANLATLIMLGATGLTLSNLPADRALPSAISETVLVCTSMSMTLHLLGVVQLFRHRRVSHSPLTRSLAKEFTFARILSCIAAYLVLSYRIDFPASLANFVQTIWPTVKPSIGSLTAHTANFVMGVAGNIVANVLWLRLMERRKKSGSSAPETQQ